MIAVLVGIGSLVGAAHAGATVQRRERALIVGGQPVPAGLLPQLAFVQDQVSPGSYAACSGTVLSSNVVLTAGHCVANETTGAIQPASGFVVATGIPNLADPAIGQLSGVSQVIPYPGWNPITHDGDVALLELATTTSAPAITLANTSETSLWQPGTQVAIAGWGLTDGANPDSMPSQVQWATTVTQTPSTCTSEASLAKSVFDPNGQLCAVDTPTFMSATCNGDSGGPILADYTSNDPIEVGITDWGGSNATTNCDPTFPNFFARADSISSWAAGWVQTLAPPTPTPVPSPAPTPTPAAAGPRVGRYAGRTSQNTTVKLSVAPSGKTVRSLELTYRLRCTQARSRSSLITPRNLSIRGLGFGAKRRSRDGETYRFAGRFTTTGAVSGTMKTRWHSRRYGVCQSPLIHWSARQRNPA
jgi:secreted trypsin-like serine protease